MNRYIPLALAFAVLAAAPVQAQEPPKTDRLQGPRVTVISAQKSEIIETVVVTGTLVPRDEVLIGPEIDGFRVVEVLAEEGDRIEKGQVLARLSRDTLEALLAQNDAGLAKTSAAIGQAESQIDQAEAALRQSRQALQRTVDLRKAGFSTQAALDQLTNEERANAARLEAAEHFLKVSKAEKLSMEAQRRELMVRFSRTEVRAPAAGVISRRMARVGAVGSMAAEPMFRLIANGEIELEGEVPELRINRVKPGQPAIITGSGASVPGTVRLVSPEVDRVTRLGKVRVTLGPGSGQRIGSFARGTIETQRSMALNVPASAVLYNEAGSYVQVVREDRIVSAPVRLGIVADSRVEILEGLAAGDMVVAKAGSFLRHGDAVTPVTETRPQAAANAGQAVR